MPVELFCLTADSLSPAHGIERAAVPTKRLHVTGITLGLGCYTAADIGVTGGQQSFKRIRDTTDDTGTVMAGMYKAEDVHIDVFAHRQTFRIPLIGQSGPASGDKALHPKGQSDREVQDQNRLYQPSQRKR